MVGKHASLWGIVVFAALLVAGCTPTPEKLLNRALVKMLKEDYPGVITDCSAVLAKEPNNIKALELRGQAYLHNRDYRLAVDDYSQLIRLEPDEPDAYARRAWILATAPDDALRNGKQALEDAQRAADIDGLEYPWAKSLAAAYAEQGDFENACRLQGLTTHPEPLDREKKEEKAHLELYRSGKPARLPAKK
jgi:cytochrome c-type biogenesis protein CcmH/NrfG